MIIFGLIGIAFAFPHGDFQEDSLQTQSEEDFVLSDQDLMALVFNGEDDIEDINGDLELRMGKEKELCEKQLEKAKLAFKNCIDKGGAFWNANLLW